MERERMIAQDLMRRGITDPRVLDAFGAVPRERFLPGLPAPYADCPQEIGRGQTISQPYIVAYMLQELGISQEHRTLEVGSGSGYVVALLARMCRHVIGVEKEPDLLRISEDVLAELHAEGIIPASYELLLADALGAPSKGPFDRILVSAAAARMPHELVEQLAQGGVMVIPVGTHDQWLWKVTRMAAGIREERLLQVRFVPLR